jgi:hypothetical protein
MHLLVGVPRPAPPVRPSRQTYTIHPSRMGVLQFSQLRRLVLVEPDALFGVPSVRTSHFAGGAPPVVLLMP